RVGENDHFFKLGGHSLLATQVVSALRTSLGVAVPLAAVFQRPTLAELSAYVEAASGAPARAASADGDRQANIPVAAPFVEERADLEMGEL
ncbi:MAG: phosphopantetheine-binding protein, partial [Polyangiaceae bacterium]|nr:phosphopantetheine-binding protein [Polyangiaceae bacterium]